ncbi:winged helix-turn-helix domain-containing protein [Candidatus Methanocrinis natronophilus]|uniref:Winged helix-turn-helix domain-containing protein n=1 Tax=Candidatus Methanocrinis natronophilus TaxID=3033396 RepID=A0ABT5X9R8_9EURY|nr:winged helix-turn-helix domain-containing protein [Candidatus Methanocrinis natronophilus]MDF0591427.1 winged helix-turn-helix domain-containing protein [Candidatus Methanocrinis natronophilus]
MTRRDRLQKIISILNICTRGANKTKIVYAANLNFRSVKPYLNLLENRGLITKNTNEDDTIVYQTTPKGKDLVNKLDSLHEMLEYDDL